MKSRLKRFWDYLDGVYGLLLILYCSLVFGTQAVLANESFTDILRGIFLAVFFSVLLCPLLLRWVKKLRSLPDGQQAANGKDRIWKAAFFLIPLLVMLVYFAAYYPGGFATDVVNQYGQAVKGQYDNWHPVIHTLFAHKLPLTVSGGWIGSVVLFQIVLLSLAIGYALCSLLRYTSRKVVLIVLAFFVLNPQTGIMGMFPFKDFSFAIGTLLLMTFALHTVFTKGAWLRNAWHMTAFILVLTAVTLFRHNAILFTVPLLFALLWYAEKKRILIICLATIVLVAAVNYPLYSALKVAKADQRQTEVLGLPMSVIGAVVVNRPEALDAETLEFAYRVAPREVWVDGYIDGYNYVKWQPETDNDVIEEYGAVRVVKMMLKSMAASPVTALKGLIGVTCPVYSLSYFYHLNGAWVIENPYGISQQGIGALQHLLYQYSELCSVIAPHLFYSLGALHLVLILAVLGRCRFKRRNELKKMCLALPVLVYNFGTALLMTGAEDACRFFYYTYLVTPLLLILYFRKKEEEPAVKGKTV